MFEASKSKIFFWLASLARKLLSNLNCVQMPARRVTIYFQTASSLVIIITILYI